MLNVIIDGIDFWNMEAMKYYVFPKTWSDDKKRAEVKNRIYSNEYMGARKMDGYWTMLIKDMDGVCHLRTRTRGVNGEYPDKYDHVPHFDTFTSMLPNGTVLLGETYLPNKPGSRNITTILGCLTDKAIARQKKEEDKLHFYCFDILAYNGKSWLKKIAKERFRYINNGHNAPYFEGATYLYGDALYNELQTYLANGGEGMVITRVDGIYAPGKRPNYTLKCKKELSDTIDCVIIGADAPTKYYGGDYLSTWDYWENEKTGERLNGRYYEQARTNSILVAVSKAYFLDWAGSLRLGLYKDGKLEYFCNVSGLTDYQKEHWKDYVGTVATITGMEISKTDTGLSIRHPKLVEIRGIGDKKATDCTYEQLL